MKKPSYVTAFLSYAREDMVTHGLKRFCRELRENVNDQLRGKTNRVFQIFSDESLRNNEEFWEQIKNYIDKSSVFLAVISPRYIRSKYCLKEYRYARENVGRKGIYTICIDKDEIPRSFRDQELGEDIFGRHYFHLPPPGARIALESSLDENINESSYGYEERLNRFSAEISEFIVQQHTHRRDVVKYGVGLFAGFGLAAGGHSFLKSARLESRHSSTAVHQPPKVRWRMGDSFSNDKRNGTYDFGSRYIKELVKEMTDGQFEIELDDKVPKEKLFELVNLGAELQCCYTAGYYHSGDDDRYSSLIFGTSVPFGLNAQQQLSWLNLPDPYSIDTDKIAGVNPTVMQSHYKSLGLDIIPFVAGGTGGQMGGWFKKQIPDTVDNFVQYAKKEFPSTGFRFRIAGLGGEIIRQGDDSISIDKDTRGGEITGKLQNGDLDAAEWIGPFEDMNIDLHVVKDVKFYYYPGWWDPGVTYELQVNREAWNKLPASYQRILKAACQQAYQGIISFYDQKNSEFLATLNNNKSIKILPFPKLLMASMRGESQRLLDEKFLNNSRPEVTRLYTEWNDFKARIKGWHRLIYFS